MQNMLPFRPPTIGDIPTIQICTQASLQSDLAAPNLYLLRHKYDTQLLFHMEHLIRFYPGKGRLCGYTYPIGGNPNNVAACLNDIKKDAIARGNKLMFCLLTETEAQRICDFFDNKVKITCDAGDADYLYNREDLAELPGTLFHKKRNRLAAFKRHFPHHSFTEMDDKNKFIAMDIAREWYAAQLPSPALLHELHAIEHALEHFNALNLCGGIVRVDGKPVGMCIASQINPGMADIHYEKCLPLYKEAYTYINNEMALHLTTPLINREEDLNVEGLRAAKISYHPCLILKKFSALIC